MRRVCVSLALVAPAIFTGCGYIHFGRIPEGGSGGDAAMATAYSNLATEHKILKQELVLVRKEGDALRAALDRGQAAPGGSGGDLAAQLTETSREFASLRTSYAKLQAERAAPVTVPATAMGAEKTELDEKLAAALRTSTQLQEENAKLRGELERTRTENLALTERLRNSGVQAERTQAALSQLNAELLAEKEGRARAEQISEAVRAQLSTVLAHRPAATEAPRETTGLPASALQIAKAPPAGSSPTAELRLNAAQLRPVDVPEPPAKSGRVHVVKAGDTLEKIARQYFGAADRWRAIYDANSGQLSNGQPMRAGMELKIPDN
jgi:nucleoid-associated protein YgaU